MFFEFGVKFPGFRAFQGLVDFLGFRVVPVSGFKARDLGFKVLSYGNHNHANHMPTPPSPPLPGKTQILGRPLLKRQHY